MGLASTARVRVPVDPVVPELLTPPAEVELDDEADATALVDIELDDELPLEETLAEELPAEEVPAEELPVEELPAEELPAEELLAAAIEAAVAVGVPPTPEPLRADPVEADRPQPTASKAERLTAIRTTIFIRRPALGWVNGVCLTPLMGRG